MQLPSVMQRDVILRSQIKVPWEARDKTQVGNYQRQTLFPLCLSAGTANTSINQYNSFALVNMAKKGKEDDSSSQEGKQPLFPTGHISPQLSCSSSFMLNFSSLFYPPKRQTLPMLDPEDALTGLPGSWESNLTTRSTSDSQDSVDEQGMTNWSQGSRTCWYPSKQGWANRGPGYEIPTLPCKPKKPTSMHRFGGFFFFLSFWQQRCSVLLPHNSSNREKRRLIQGGLCTRGTPGNSLSHSPKVKLPTKKHLGLLR